MSTDAVEIEVQPYGVLDDQLGGPTLTVAVPAPHSVDTLLAHLAERFPEASSALAQTAAARNDRLLARDAILTEGESIALLPPVSGGQSDVPRLTEDPLDPAALMAETENEAAGAVVLFGGTVRATNRDKTVTAIEYSAYKPLAESTLAAIESEIRAETGIVACRLQHRIGRLGPGEASVYVAVRAGHRDAAFEAGRRAIDTIKVRVPIWKNEHFADGTSEYVAGTSLSSAGESSS